MAKVYLGNSANNGGSNYKIIEYPTMLEFPTVGDDNTLYIALDTSKMYLWSGTVYTELTGSLVLGETSSTAYRGDRGKYAYDEVGIINPKITTLQNDVEDLGNIQNELKNQVGVSSELPIPTSSVCTNIGDLNGAIEMADFKTNQNTASISTLANNQGDLSLTPLGNGSDLAENIAYLNARTKIPSWEYVTTITAANGSNSIQIPFSRQGNYKFIGDFIVNSSGSDLNLNFSKDAINFDTSNKYSYVVTRQSSNSSDATTQNSENATKIKLNSSAMPSGYSHWEIDIYNADASFNPIVKSSGSLINSTSNSVGSNTLVGYYIGTDIIMARLQLSTSSFNALNGVKSQIMLYRYRYE